MTKVLSSWSGGKDSCYALFMAVAQGMQPTALLNMMHEEGKLSRSHGIPLNILQHQAHAMGLPLIAVPATWGDYEDKYIQHLKDIVEMYHIDTVVYGDIDLQEHRDWEEMVCMKADVNAYLPLWLKDRKMLVLEMIDKGVKSVIVSCNEQMGHRFLGRVLDKVIIKELEAVGVDVCGENGEFHTLVVDCPLFSEEIAVDFGEKVLHEGYWFLEVRSKE